MSETVLSPSGPRRGPTPSPRTSSAGCPGSSRWTRPSLTDRHWAGLVDAGAGQVALFHAAGARPRHPRRAHQDRQGHLLQSGSRPAAGASASSSALGGVALQRLHLLRLGPRPLRRPPLEATRRRAAPARRGHRGGYRPALERHRRGLRRADRDPRRFGPEHVVRCAMPVSTTSPSPTSSTAPPSSTGPTG